MSLDLRLTAHQAAYQAGVPQTVYALLDLQPLAVQGRMPLDLRLVLDHSGSMGSHANAGSRQSKLALLKDAVQAMIGQLEVGDRVMVVAFDDTASTMYDGVIRGPKDLQAAQKAVKQIPEGGGTSVLAGLESAMTDAALPGHVGRLVLVTDGETNDGEESHCERLAFDQRGQMTWLVYGIGVSYNDRFLDALARANGGTYAHLSDMKAAAATFAAEVDVMGDIALTNLVVNVEPAPGVEIARADRIVPQTVAVPVAMPGFLSVDLGDVDRGRGQKLLLQLTVPALGVGTQAIAMIRCGYHVPVKKLLNQTLDRELLIAVAAEAGVADGEVLRTIQLAGANRLTTLGMAELAGGDADLAARTLASSAALYDQLGLAGMGQQLRTLTSAAQGSATLSADAEDVRRTLTTMARQAWTLGDDADVP
jgi:Mg-chelatase subunit ChlD